MKRFNSGVITLLIIAAYFIATAFIPDLYLAFNYKLIFYSCHTPLLKMIAIAEQNSMTASIRIIAAFGS